MECGSAAYVPVQYIRGLPIPDAKWFVKKNVEDAMDYVPQDRDIIITSYPKTGSTWMQYIVLQILSKGDKFPTFNNMITKDVPFLEMTGTQVIESLPSPRLYKHHFPYNMVQKNDKAKWIYTYRNPADVVVSYYNFLLELFPDLKLEFDGMFKSFLNGSVGYGSYFDHVLSFYPYRNKNNLLMVSYEKLLINREEEFIRIAKFLGDEYEQILLEDRDVLDRIIKHTKFDYMKKNLSFTHPTAYENKDGKNTVIFFRKGIIGDGKKILTDVQRQELNDAIRTRMNGIEIAEEWLNM